MSITSVKYDAVSEEAFIDGTLQWVTDNFKEVADLLYPNEDLDDFAETALGMVKGFEDPALGIGPRRNASTESEDESRLREALSVALAVVVTDENPEKVTRKIQRYMRILEATLRRANKDDLFGTINSSHTFGFVMDCEHVYSQDIRSNGTSYLREATLELTVEINEVRVNM